MTDQLNTQAGSAGHSGTGTDASMAGANGGTSTGSRTVAKHVARVAEFVQIFKRLMLPTKLQRNKDIETANKARSDKMLNHMMDPVSFPDDASSFVSFFSFEEEDYRQLADPMIFNRHKDIIPDYMVPKIKDFETKRKAEQAEVEDASASKRRRRDGDTMIPLTWAGFQVDFPNIYKDTVDNDVVLPLSFFMPKNVTYIATHLSEIDTKRVNCKGNTKVTILDVTKILARGRYGDKAHFKSDMADDFTFAEFRIAGAQVVAFEKLRDDRWCKDQEEGSWTTAWRDHFDFWSNHADSLDLYKWWRKKELKMRETMITQNIRYTEAHYFAAMEGARMTEDTVTECRGNQGSTSSDPSGRRNGTRSNADNDRRPFQGGSGGNRQPAPIVCLKCAGKDHTTKNCTCLKGTWAKVVDDDSLAVIPQKRRLTSAPSAEVPRSTLSLGTASRTLATEEFLQLCLPPPLFYPPLSSTVVSRPPFDPAIHNRSDLFNKIVTPYDANAFEYLLNKHGLTELYPHLVHNLRHGFPIGNMPPLEKTAIFKNHPSVEKHMDAVDAYLAEEVAAGRMNGPFSQQEVESALRGPFQSSPLIVAVSVQAPGEPDKIRVCRHLSKGNFAHPSVNSFIEKEDFPTRFDSATKTAEAVSHAPEGFRACTCNVSKFHRTCPVCPHHKAWLVVQGRPDQFFIDHCIPFGTSSASSNAGMIANAVIDIWRGEGVDPVFKYEDDNCIWQLPVSSGPFEANGFFYAYDKKAALDRIAPLNVPWHPEKGTPDFCDDIEYLGLGWDLKQRQVYLPEKKRLKHLRRVRIFLAKSIGPSGCTLLDVQKIHGSLCYISFVYVEGRSRLPSISNFMSTFNRSMPLQTRHPRPSTIADLRWWSQALESPDVTRNLTPPGPLTECNIYVDASTSWGIGIIIDNAWFALKLSPDWKTAGGPPSRDICWLETVAVEVLALILVAQGLSNHRIHIHSDNQGTIGAMGKGRSPNYHINMSIRRTFVTLSSALLSPSFSYIESASNPADPISRGELGSPRDHRSAGGAEKFPGRGANAFLPRPGPTSKVLPTSTPFGGASPSSFHRIPFGLSSRSVSEPSLSSRLVHQAPRSVSSDSDTRSSSTLARYTPYPARQSLGAKSTSDGPTPVFSSSRTTPVVSNADTLRPPVIAAQRLIFWKTPFSIAKETELRSNLPAQVVESARQAVVMGLAPNTLLVYGAGILRFTQYCDLLGISEENRMPCSISLISSFATKAAGFYSGKTVLSWLSGIRCWHVINQAPWHGDDPLVKLARSAAFKKGTSFQRPKRPPVTIAHLRALGDSLDVSTPLHAAIWAVALVTFFGCRRLGETVVSGKGKFSPSFHVTRKAFPVVKPIRDGRFSASFQIPWTKTTKHNGGTVVLTSRNDDLCPVAALVNHFRVNHGLPDHVPMFAFRSASGDSSALEKPDFMFFVSSIWESKGLEAVYGHSFRIGGTVALLLAGVPPEVVAATGGWTSLTFLTYWRSVADIISLSTSSAYNCSDVSRLTMIVDSLRGR
ncbi:hypothetical protein NP233_g8831 [Leucocoprinus birnbaumii]|uniref:Uncharacterized protein n=1 Tax=Leucocoprinus birnbaumii TaxID=56174 RepID=A0AAD5YNQ3_9AGAR|nr:hypothetical protein NP233_g8831 [Leucocoprinus birnbaumii]